jgi:protein SCO1/2
MCADGPPRGAHLNRGAAHDLLLLIACVVVLALAACSKPAKESFKATDVTGAPWGKALALTDHTGKPRTLEDFKGKVVAIYFGYAQCPDVCPTTMALLADVRKKLGADADRMQVLFVTVDPERDTREVLAAYVPAFDPTFIGLTGTPDEIARAAKEFKVFYSKSAGPTPTSYTVDHTSGVFIFDAAGRLRLFAGPALTADDYVHDVKLLLAGK